ncbi:MAG: Amidase [Frankiales bacterium]|nr:Amidase [Frankiales bacterium]
MTVDTARDTATASRAADQLPLTITEAGTALRSGAITAVALTQAVQARADVLDPILGCYITRTNESALAAAATADAELAAGLDRGPLHGIPLGIKDIIATNEAPTTAQSLILDPQFGQQGDAVVVRRLRAAGAVITGKATTMEYAIGAPDSSKGFPTPRNPYNLEHWTGGSSSGTGNGVAAGMFLGGLGTDTGGSVRMPAAWCGISGMKQTFGRVPKSGCVPLGMSLDHIGPMTRSARDCAAMLAVMAGHDNSDACSVDRPVDDYLAALTGDVTGLRVGVDLSFLDRTECDPDVAAMMRAAVDVFADAGALIVPVALPLYEELSFANRVTSNSESSTYHRPDLKARWSDYGKPTRMAIGRGMLIAAADYVQAQRVRRVGVRAAAEMFADVDLVLTPTCLSAAPNVEGLDFFGLFSSLLMSYWNAIGHPAMSIPMGLTSAGLPVGLQLGGRPFEEATIFRAADAFQLHTDHHLQESPLVLDLLG